MRSRSLRILALALVFSLPWVTRSQTPFNLDAKTESTGSAPIGGKTSIDLIRLEAMPSVPLRNGGVIPQSESLQLDGKILRRGDDYSVDYATGTVFLKVQIKVGQTLRAHYRYDPTKASVAANSTGFGAPGNVMSLNLSQSTGVVLGFGMTERLQDGTLVNSNVYGIKNNFSLGQGAMKGLFIVSERKKVHAESLYDYQGQGAAVDEGKAQALMQDLNVKVAGGTVQAGVQDIGEKFSGFQAFKESGIDDKAVGQLQKEKGLKRFGFGLDKIGLGNLKFSSGYRQVKDNLGSIEWRNYGLNLGAFSFSWNGQKVDPQFGRFQDLAEGDREWLAKEKGLDRQTMQAGFTLKNGKIEFVDRKIEDTDGKGIYARRASFDLGKYKLGWYDQHIEAGFNRFGSLRDAEAGQWAKEAGLRRQGYSLEMNPILGLRASNNTIRTDTGDYKAMDVALGGKNWTLEHSLRAADSGFASTGAMSEPEIQGNLQAIAKMYDASGQGLRGEDRNWFFQSAGIERKSYRLTTNPLKGLGLSAERVDLLGQKDDAHLDNYKLTAKNFTFGYRSQQIGRDFAEIGKVTDFERARLGPIQGLDRTDMTFSAQLDKNRSVTASQLHASGPNGDVSREQFGFNDKNLQLNYVKRSVDNTFENANQLVDPEKDLFAAIRGFDQADLSLKWSPFKNLKIDMAWSDAKSDALDQQRVYRNSVVLWQPDKYTQIAYNRLDQRNDDPTQLLLGNQIERFAVTRNFGRLGTLQYSQENRDYDGAQTNTPDSRSQTVAFETKITDKTAIRTEQTRTDFSNGEKEHVSQNTLSAEVTKRTGVSVTETRIDRDGEKPDETKRNYGFWWDLGRGMRFAYGYARQLNSLQPGTMSSQVSLTPGQIGGVKVDAANYNTNRWDSTRNQSVGAVSLGTVNPLQIGFIRDFTFNLSANTARDNNAWQAENDRFGVGWRVGSNTFGYQYSSQITPSGDRAIDRLFNFATDQSDKRWLKASISYKIRTLPNDQQVMVRNFSITAKPTKGLELTHQLLTNPEQARGDVILGSLTQPTRSNKWKLDYTGSASFKAGLSWEEMINEQNKTLSRIGGVNLTLFANNPSPLSLFYGVEQGDLNGQRRTAHRYSLRFDQRPGPNQLLSLFIGNLSWQHSRPEDQKLQNWNVRMEYQLRF